LQSASKALYHTECSGKHYSLANQQILQWNSLQARKTTKPHKPNRISLSAQDSKIL
jgi:hypothetical protein